MGHEEEQELEDFKPIGVSVFFIALMILFLIMYFAMYFLMLSRG
ncbi:hypothetical protein BH23BAC3_BH23BAC3_13820 [soil metagenome]